MRPDPNGVHLEHAPGAGSASGAGPPPEPGPLPEPGRMSKKRLLLSGLVGKRLLLSELVSGLVSQLYVIHVLIRVRIVRARADPALAATRGRRDTVGSVLRAVTGARPKGLRPPGSFAAGSPPAPAAPVMEK